MTEAVQASLATVVAIPVTPFNERNEIDRNVYGTLIRRQVEGGVTAITANGNTSEFYALHPTERRLAVELTIENAPDAVVVNGVGLDLQTAIEDARHASDAGASCLMVHQPPHPYRSQAGWVEYHRQISRAVPEVGLIPYLRDPNIGHDAVRSLLDACPNLAGIKYAVADPAKFTSLVAAVGAVDFAWICGLAETWAPFFFLGGARGFTSGLVTIAPQMSLSLMSALAAGDYDSAMKQWRSMAAFEALRARDQSELNVSAVKEALAQLGLCPREVRPPIGVLKDDDKQAVSAILQDWGFAVAFP